MNIQLLIRQHNLKIADVVELAKPGTSFPKHYAFYIGIHDGKECFLANTTEGVRVICGEELNRFMQQFIVLDVERPCKTDQHRHRIIRRALSRLGEKDYHLIFNNCEHFKNWVLYGESKSKQVLKAGAGLFVAGAAIAAVGYASKKKGLQKAGLIIMASPLIIVAAAVIIVSLKRS